MTLGCLATTIDFKIQIKKPVPLHTSLHIECVIESVAGLRINTAGKMLDASGALLASCTAQLVDMAQLRAASSR